MAPYGVITLIYQDSNLTVFLMLQLVINMSDDDPRRMDEIRKYAAIYGRFDCKRKPEKPLTLHEVSLEPMRIGIQGASEAMNKVRLFRSKRP